MKYKKRKLIIINEFIKKSYFNRHISRNDGEFVKRTVALIRYRVLKIEKRLCN
jgi:hypothetical protein